MYSQLSTKHYLPPLYSNTGGAERNLGLESAILLSTPLDTLFTVSVYKGALKKPIAELELSSQKPFTYLVKRHLISLRGEENLNVALKDRGLRFEAKFPFYLNLRSANGGQGLSLTSKGTAALGKSFRSGHMVVGPKVRGRPESGLGPESKSNFISIMATSNNTIVKLSEVKEGVIFRNLEVVGKSRKKYTTKDFQIKLNKYECCVFATVSEDFHYGDENKSFGTLITSDKDVVVNVGSIFADAPHPKTTLLGWGGDIGADQIVPVSRLGNEYVLIRGEGDDFTERAVVIATESNTVVKSNNKETTLYKAGDFIILDGKSYSHDTKNLHIVANKPLCIYQTIAGSFNVPQTCGLNFIAPLNECQTANKVSISDLHYLGNQVVVNMITKPFSEIEIINSKTNKPVKSFYAERPNIENIENTPWVTFKYKLPKDVENIHLVSDDAVNVSISNNGGAFGTAGYFSGFSAPPLIIAKGGILSFYENNKQIIEVKNKREYPLYKLYKDDKFVSQSRKGSFEVSDYGTYIIEGVDPSCNLSSKSLSLEIKPLEKIETYDDVEDLYVEEPESHIEKIILEDTIDSKLLVPLNFQYNSEKLVNESILVLEKIITSLKKYPKVKIEIGAHTDCKGSDDYNLKLSQKRAFFIRNFMISKGIDGSRLIAKGYGESKPLSYAMCNSCDENCSDFIHALNRRSEFKIISK